MPCEMTRAQEKAMYAKRDREAKKQRMSNEFDDVEQVTNIKSKKSYGVTNKIHNLALEELKNPIPPNSKLIKSNKIDYNLMDEINDWDYNYNAKKLGLKVKYGQNIKFVYTGFEDNINNRIWKENGEWRITAGDLNDVITNPDEFVHDSAILSFVKSKNDKKVIIFLSR